MSNHYHLVPTVNNATVKAWSGVDIAVRCKTLFHGRVMVNRWMTNKDITYSETKNGAYVDTNLLGTAV